MSLRILFMGTPEFAVPTLLRLADLHQVVAVITAPDKPAGRGLKERFSAVKEAALKLHLPLFQPERLDDPQLLESLRTMKPDLGVVVAFRQLPRSLFSLPRLGTINLHASLLPQYRGAAPIQRAIMAGETVTGLTTFFLDDNLDTGQVLLQESLPIGDDENAGQLHDRMKTLGAELVARTISLLESGKAIPQPQAEGLELKRAPKIRPADLVLDFARPVNQLYNQVRALAPTPAAHTVLGEEMLKILKAEKVPGSPELPPGTACTDEAGRLLFSCTDGYLAATLVQRPGRRPMPHDAFLRGWPQASRLARIDLGSNNI